MTTPSFTSEIKREILSLAPIRDCCGRASLSALLVTSGAFKRERLEFVSENERIAQYFLGLMESVFGVRPEVNGAVFDPKREKDKLTFTYRGERLSEMKERLAYSEGDIFDLIADDCCALSYIRSAFLGSGSCTLPHGTAKTGYHLEVVFPRKEEAEAFSELLLRFELFSRIIVRGEKHVVYLKSEDALSDFFGVIGANGALSRLENVTSSRAENNRENRLNNCYAGNADKSAIASAQQVLMFQKMQTEGRLSQLSEQLRETALCRLEKPSLSLFELAEEMGISKSCLNHRLRKITEIYRQTEENYD